MLIYSQDGLGLGHMRRTSLLAAEFLRQVPGASALTLSDSPLGQFFATAPGHDFLKLPSIRKSGPGEWEAVSLSASFRDVLALRRRLIASAVREFDPDILLVDHMPHGAMGELVPALQKLRNHRAQVVLGLRDVIDNPEVVRRRWTAEGAYEALEEFYDEVLVYGSRDVLDVAREYAWPKGPSQHWPTRATCAASRTPGPDGSRSWPMVTPSRRGTVAPSARRPRRFSSSPAEGPTRTR